MKKTDIEMMIATIIIMVYTTIMTIAGLSNNGALAFWDTAVFVCLLYICKQADRYEKAELRHREARSREIQQAMDELEAWREQKEAD
jgi:hypothetical protein